MPQHLLGLTIVVGKAFAGYQLHTQQQLSQLRVWPATDANYGVNVYPVSNNIKIASVPESFLCQLRGVGHVSLHSLVLAKIPGIVK